MEDLQKQTVILIGSGGVEKAWCPVLRAIRKANPNAPEGIDGANHYFASLVFEGRDLKRMRGAQQEEVDKAVQQYGQQVAFRPAVDEFGLIEQHRKQLKTLRELVSEELKQAVASKEVQLRSSARRLKELAGEDPVQIFTTNWDTTVNALSQAPVVYLHGNMDDPNSLYLPSQVVDDAPGGNSQYDLRAAMGQFLVAGQKARRIVFYGVSLTLLDIELGGVLRLIAFHRKRDKLGEHYVVDSDPERVAQRLMFYGWEGLTKLAPPELWPPRGA